MTKKLLVTFLLLFIPFTLISCDRILSNINENQNTESNNLNSNNSNKTTEDSNKNFEAEDSNKNSEAEDSNKNSEAEDSNKNSEAEDSNKNSEAETKIEIVSKDVRLFYYDVNNDQIVYINDTIEVRDKAVATAIVNALKTPSNEKLSPAIAKDIKLNSAKVDASKDTITLDFSNNFVKAQNLGSGPESMTLLAIANTFGYNFNVNNVIITLDGEPYGSGHIYKNPGEAFKVNYNNTVELK